jgi:hypothetical protein
MSTAAVTVLDHIDNITVPGNVFAQPANEYWALICLRQGMEFLYHQARKCDEVMRQQVNPRGNLNYFGMGNLPEMRAVPTPLLTCAFHWYAISACQYARTVGAIACRQDASRPLPPHYVAAVMPDVLAFRDKVAAHFAWSTQHSKDNDAERLASILPPLTFEDDSFHVGGFTVGLQSAGKQSSSQSIAPWSICKVHERLRLRYWPSPSGEAGTAEP